MTQPTDKSDNEWHELSAWLDDRINAAMIRAGVMHAAESDKGALSARIVRREKAMRQRFERAPSAGAPSAAADIVKRRAEQLRGEPRLPHHDDCARLLDMIEREIRALPSSERPIDMLLFCPRCGLQHVDEAEPESGWTNPPHATHTCKGCGLNWRPSNALTNGVGSLPAAEEKHVERMKASDPLRWRSTVSHGSSIPLEPTEHMRAALRAQFKGQDNYAYEEAFWRDWKAVVSTLSHELPKISGVSLVKAFKDQRDECADVLRRLMHKLREESGSEDPMEPFAYDASWKALAVEADAILAKCPSYSQQINNLCAGLGITRGQLEAALSSASAIRESEK